MSRGNCFSVPTRVGERPGPNILSEAVWGFVASQEDALSSGRGRMIWYTWTKYSSILSTLDQAKSKCCNEQDDFGSSAPISQDLFSVSPPLDRS